MKSYKKADRVNDFHFFCNNARAYHEKYGDSYIAIQNEQFLGNFQTIDDALISLEAEHPMGTYILQECTDAEVKKIELAQQRSRKYGRK